MLLCFPIDTKPNDMRRMWPPNEAGRQAEHGMYVTIFIDFRSI